MDKYNIIDSDIIYDKFEKHYSLNKYKIDIKKDNIYATAFRKLFFNYLVICFSIFIVSKLYPNEIFGGMTFYKMLKIFGIILFFFVILFILSIFGFTTKKEEYLATLSLWKVLNEEGVLDSKKSLEVIDFLYKNNNKVGSFYIKLFNIIKNSGIVKYFKWLITLFIGFYAGIISSIFMKYIEKEARKDLLNYISLIGKELVSIIFIVFLFSILYYCFIYIIYNDQNKKHDLYILALRNVKYILLKENTKDEIQNLIENSKEKSVMENKTDESKIMDKDKKVENSTKELENLVRQILEEKLNNHRSKYNRYLYSFSILAIITLLISVVYVIIYFNSDSKLVRSPKLLLFFYIILIFINLVFRILNNCLDLNFKDISCSFKDFLTNTGINYSFILCIIALVPKLQKLQIFIENKIFDDIKSICDYFSNFILESLFILIILLIIGNTIKKIRIFLKGSNILEKYKSS